MNRRVLLAGLVLVVPLVVVLGLSFGRETHKVRSPLVGRAAPPFSLARLGDKVPISLVDLKGKPAVLNFWATWCQPCQAEHGVLQAAAREWKDKVPFVGIVYEDEEPVIQEFLDRNGSGYPTLVDIAGKTAIAYGVYGVPETFFVDANGIIVDKYQGPLSRGELEKSLRKLVGRP